MLTTKRFVARRAGRRPKRIRTLLIVENCAYPQDVRVRREAEALRSAGYEVSVISPGRPHQPWREVCNGIRVFRFPEPLTVHSFVGYAWEYSYATCAIFVLSLVALALDGFDILHSANPPETMVLIAAFYKLLGKRFIFDHHDLSPELYKANFGGKARSLIYYALVGLEWLTCRLADQVIATNQSYKDVEMARAGVPEQRITIVRNGPDPAELLIPAATRSVRKDAKTVIVYAGYIGFHDGVDYLLRALRHLVYGVGRSDFVCILIGKGESLGQMKHVAAQLGLDDYVRFTGWLPQAEFITTVSSADICVAPDPCNPFNDQSTMIKIAEYMALGKPVVAFDLRESRFTAREAAIFVRPNDEQAFAKALAQLMDDPSRRKAMGSFGRCRVESELAWSHSIPNLLSAYRAVLPFSGPPGAVMITRDPDA